MKNKSLPVVLALAACMLSFGCNKKAAEGGDKEEAKPVAEVTLTKVERAELAQDLLVSGNLAAPPNHDAKVSALVAGRVAKVDVNEGDDVIAGQELAELESGPLRDAVHQAEAAVSLAQANLENARLAADRNEDLLKRGIAARKEVEDARTQVRVNEASLKQAEAALSTAKTQVSRAIVRAPFAGTVVKRFASAGEQVDGTAAQPVVEIADISTLELLGGVPAARISEIKAGEAFTFDSSSFPDVKFTAHIVTMLPAVDPSTNNGTVRIRVDNPKHLMKLGMFMTLALPLKGGVKRILVDKQAVYPDEAGEPHVYKVEGDNAEAVAVKLGLQTKDKAELVSGAAEGDTVILTGGYGLPEKSKVKVKKAEEPSAKDDDEKGGGATPADAKKPDTGEPKAAKPDPKSPGAKSPDAKTPDITKPDNKKPDTKTPDVKVPDVKKPDTKKTDTKTPDTKAPDAKKPSAAAPRKEK